MAERRDGTELWSRIEYPVDLFSADVYSDRTRSPVSRHEEQQPVHRFVP